MKALLATVGTGTGVHEAIARSIAAQQPEVLVLLVSETSGATLALVADYLETELHEPELAARCREEGCGCELLRITDAQAERLDSCYQRLLDSMRRLEREQGVDWLISAVDFTSGTKVMSAAAVLAGRRMECGSLLYQGGGTRDENTGRVLPGESALRLTGIAFLSWEEAWREISVHFDQRQFAACRRAINYWLERLPMLAQHFRWLDMLVQSYAAWDLFDHVDAARHFAREAALRPAGFQGEARLAANAARAATLARVFAGGGDRARRDGDFLAHEDSVLLLADLFANAERRAVEEKYDDALARLYRLSEMVVQYRLRTRHRLRNDAVPISFLEAQGLNPTDYNRARPRNGAISIGRWQSYQLLADLGDGALTEHYRDCAFEQLLDRRNTSILAHGFCPVDPQIYGDLCPRVHALCELVDTEFASHLEHSTFLTLAEA